MDANSISSDLNPHYELEKLKLNLKLWELNFKQSNARKPTKDDIKAAPEEIQGYYTQYWKLKEPKQNQPKIVQNATPQIKCADKSQDQLEVWNIKLNKEFASLTKTVSSETKVSTQKTYSLRNVMKDFKSPVQSTKRWVCSENKIKPITVKANSEITITPKSPQLITQETITPFIKEDNAVCSRDHQDDYECAIISPYTLLTQNTKKRNVNTDWLQRCEESIWDSHSNKSSRKMEDLTKAKLENEHCASEDYDLPFTKNTDVANYFADETQLKPVANVERDLENRCGKSPMEICDDPNPAIENNDTSSNKTVECSKQVIHLKPQKSTLKREVSEILEDNDTVCSQPKKKCKTSSYGCESVKSKSNAQVGNYVRVNLKKKIFVRGKKKFNYKRYRWQKYKNYKRNQMQEDDEVARNWKSPKRYESKKKPAKKQVNTEQEEDSSNDATPDQSSDNEIIPDDEMVSKTNNVLELNLSIVEPLYNLNPTDGKIKKTPKVVFTTLKKFGYDEFRVGQETAVMRTLSGLSTLVVLPTGSGKSLCYQLPAYLYSQNSLCITLVVSPLVSLMDDQVANMPTMVKAACLHNNMTATKKDKIRSDISAGKVRVLFVSPEAVVARLNGGFSCMPKDMPPIAFVCIDEVHCLWEWSFNFRPSYLQLCKALRRELGVKCILGLTATATATTMQNVAHHLGIEHDPDAIIQFLELPKNLHFSITRDENREQALLSLLQNDRFTSCSSIIIYCITRAQTERLATLIRTALQGRNTDDIPWTAEAYHAGLTAMCRRRVQTRFVTGKLRVVVATVAFGMGLNMPDVRAVIHFGLPNSFESYIQEVGRAGRDGKQSYCHVLLDTLGQDLQELRRHVFANSVDRQTIRRFLEQVFPHCHCNKDFEMEPNTETVSECKGHEVAIPVKDAIMSFDLKEEGIATLLCLLELHPGKYVDFLPSTLATCKIRCYGGSEQLQQLKKKSPAIAVAMAKFGNSGQKFGNILQFPVIEVSFLLGCKSQEVKRQMRALEWKEIIDTDGNKRWRRTGVRVELCDEAFHFIAKGGLSSDQKDDVLNCLYDRVVAQEKKGLHQLDALYKTLLSSAHQSARSMEDIDEKDIERSERLRCCLSKYFQTDSVDYPETQCSSVSEEHNKINLEGVRADIRNFVCIHQEHTFSGRSVARIFHGISSPRFPAEVWARVRNSWRSHLDLDFNVLCQIATEEILKMKS